MKINVEQIPENGLVLEYEQPPEAFPVIDELTQTGESRFSKPISVHLEVKRFGQIVNIRGDFDTRVRLACGRCLRLFDQKLHARFQMVFSQLEQGPDPEMENEADMELTSEDLGTIAFQGDELDLSDALQEEVVMALPMQPLCRKSCKGLCPQCGADLNSAPCSCSKPAPNSTFAILKHLKLKK